MAVLGRVGLFLVVNALVVVTVTAFTAVTGLGGYMSSYGIDYGQLAIFCLLWGFTGSFISLLLSRAIAKISSGVQVIDPNTTDPALRELVTMVYDLSRKANLPAMPEVGIYDAPELNAFATGPSASRSLVAVSTGLLSRMDRREMYGVLGHEISHIANGDMVTMTLLQGIVNAFVMFCSRIVAFALTQGRRSDDRGPGIMYYLVQMVLEFAFMFLGMIVVSWFSRYREFRADKGGARLAGRENMISALAELQRTYELTNPAANPTMSMLQISSKPTGLQKLFSSHPPLEERIKRLQSLTGEM